MKKCTKCGKVVQNEEIVKKEVLDIQSMSLEDLLKERPEEELQPPKKIIIEVHTRMEVRGCRRPGAYGGWTQVRRDCGPLRDLTTSELSEQEELERIEALMKR